MTVSQVKKIAVIVGSCRPVRIGPKVTKLVMDILEPYNATASEKNPIKLSLSIVEIASFKLPVFDENVVPAIVPMLAQWQNPHSLAWSAEMNKYDGYILTTPEYNEGPPGSVKNAFDYLYHELQKKPIVIVSYGKEGGRYSSESLKRSFEALGMKVMKTRPQLAYSARVLNDWGLPMDLQLAGQGTIGEDSEKDWKGQKDEIIKAFHELKSSFVEVEN